MMTVFYAEKKLKFISKWFCSSRSGIIGTSSLSSSLNPAAPSFWGALADLALKGVVQIFE